MHVGARGLREPDEKIFEGFNREVANAVGFDYGVYHAVWPATAVDCGGGQGFIHGHPRVAPAENAFFPTERLLYGFPEHDAYVLVGVMLVHIEIAARVDLQIKRAVTRY